MTPQAERLMLKMLTARRFEPGCKLLDVGSLDVNGTYRPMAEELGFTYWGIDVRPGPNVDQVVDPNWFPFKEGEFDAVISGSTMEHVQYPWRWLPECARLVKPGGILAVVTHWMWEQHDHPKDYWRFMPEGMQTLFDLCGGMEPCEVTMEPLGHIAGYAFKRQVERT